MNPSTAWEKKALLTWGVLVEQKAPFSPGPPLPFQHTPPSSQYTVPNAREHNPQATSNSLAGESRMQLSPPAPNAGALATICVRVQCFS